MIAISAAETIAETVKHVNAHSKWWFATNGAAATGPTTRVRLFAADWSDTALGMSAAGTALDASAKLAGPANAKLVPSPRASASTIDGVIQPSAVNTASVHVSAATMA